MEMQNNYPCHCCVITPCQGSSGGFPDGDARCVTVVPSQEAGYLMPDDYRFSDGYSLDYQQMGNQAPMQSTFECDPSVYGVGGYEQLQSSQVMYQPQEVVAPGYVYTYADNGGFQEVMGTESVPQVSDDPAPLTTEFFASNSAFKRIPICPSRTVFRRRRQGDPTNEWSNAFLNEEQELCETAPCCTG